MGPTFELRHRNTALEDHGRFTCQVEDNRARNETAVTAQVTHHRLHLTTRRMGEKNLKDTLEFRRGIGHSSSSS